MPNPKIKIVADLHIHTISSGHAYSTIEEYARRAADIGLKGIAVTDHGPAMPGAPHYYHFANLRMVEREILGVRIFKGAEANIIDESGRLDLPDEILKELEIVMAAFHVRLGYEDRGEAGNTEVLLKAMDNPFVNLVAHPGNPMYPVNAAEIAAKAKERGIALEINNSSFTGSREGSRERCLAIAKAVKKAGGTVVINSDSHMAWMLGTFSEALKIAEQAGLGESHIVNTSIERVERELIKNSKGKIQK